MQLIQIDNVIPKSYQDQLEAEISALGWFFHAESARPGVEFTNNFGGFFHLAFDVASAAPVVSAISAMLIPLLFVSSEKAGLTFKDLIRIRLGLFPNNGRDVPYHNPHVDFYEPHMVGLYYVNDSDGDTIVFNETSEMLNVQQSATFANEGKFTELGRVRPKKGTMAFFDGKHYHASMHPLKASHRIVVTFDFR